MTKTEFLGTGCVPGLQIFGSAPAMTLPRLSVMLCVASMTLASCGGSGGGGSSDPNASLIVGGVSGEPASTATTEQIQMLAAKQASEGLGLNLSSLQRLSDDVQDNMPLGGVAEDLDPQLFQNLDTDNNNFLFNTLGVDDSTAMVTREGDVVTIDPDEQRICADEFPLVESINDDIANCQQLLAGLTVEINAYTDETGVITYLYQGTPVLLIGYSPQGASYELNLAGLQTVMEASDQISDGTVEPLLVTMTGALRLSATVTNDQPGSEAGELAFEVTQALSISPNDGSSGSFSLQPSTLFRINSDEATGDVSTSVNWGAMQLIAEAGDSEGNSTLTQLNLGGLSAGLTLNADSTEVKITNIGIGNVPLNISINQVNSLSVSLSTFGITLDEDTGMLTLDGALGAQVTLSNLMNFIEDVAPELTATVSLNAPAGTAFVEQQDGTVKLTAGGPFTATVVGTTNDQTLQQTITVNQGDCIVTDDDADLGVEIAPCN